jgi:D-tyrosyl-tRNA(Tyr) deacylase
MPQAECSIGASSIDLICTDNFRVVAMTAAISPRLAFQYFSFVVGIKAQSIEKRKAFTCHQDGNLGSKLNIASCFTTHDWPDMSLAEADNAIRDTSAIRVVKNVLLTDRLADNQELL